MVSDSNYDTIEGRNVPCLLNRKISNGRFLLKKRLGCGGYSVVYLADDLHAPRGRRVAVKCLLRDNGAKKVAVAKEAALHRRVACLPGVVDIYCTVEDLGLFFVIMEYCDGGDLFTMITESRGLLGHDNLIKRSFLQLLDTVRAMHDLGVFHRDLKPENILCNNGGNKLLIADFGLATESEKNINFRVGSYFYMTPECLAGNYSNGIKFYSSRAADIWALGVILINMITSRSPWKVAMLSDPSYLRYHWNRHYLRQMLPLSYQAFEFVDKIFSNHGNNLNIADLRTQFLEIDTFTMDEKELATAHKTARLVAREWMPDAPVDDIKQEEILNLHDITNAEVFEEAPFPSTTAGNESPRSTTTAVSDETAASDEITITVCSPALSDALTAASLEEAQIDASTSHSSLPSSASSESDFPITPETHAVQAVEVVPELPEDQLLGEKWISASVEKTTGATGRKVDADIPDGNDAVVVVHV